MKFTRQKVRDLNHLITKSVGRKLDEVPASQMCSHPKESRREIWDGKANQCNDCGETWDCEGRPI